MKFHPGTDPEVLSLARDAEDAGYAVRRLNWHADDFDICRRSFLRINRPWVVRVCMSNGQLLSAWSPSGVPTSTFKQDRTPHMSSVVSVRERLSLVEAVRSEAFPRFKGDKPT